MISAIVAVDEDWGIGFNGSLLERIPDDLKHFKELTEGNIVIMGRKTQDSLSNKYLFNRTNIVMTNKKLSDDEVFYGDLKTITSFLDITKIYSIGYDRWNSFNTQQMPQPKDVFIIGGSSVYYQLLPYCDRIYLTMIYKHHEDIDAYFPNIYQMKNEWELFEAEEPKTYKDIKYQFMIYDRKS